MNIYIVMLILACLSSASGEEYDEYGFETKRRAGDEVIFNKVYIPNPNEPLPRNGTVIGWSFYASNRGPIYLQIWRRTNFYYYLRLIGQVKIKVLKFGIHNIKQTVPFYAQKGDLVGIYFPWGDVIPFDGRECSNHRGFYHSRYNRKWYEHDDPMSGRHVYGFSHIQHGKNPCRVYSLKVRLLKNND